MYRRMAVSALLLGLLLVTQCQGRRLDVSATGHADESTEQLSGPVFIVVVDETEDSVTAAPSGASLPVIVEK
jgi:hypothetical protein